MNSERTKSDSLGATMGFITFIGGIGLLLFTFKVAFDLFSVPPSAALGVEPGKGIDIARAGESLTTVVVRLLLLLVMAFVGSSIANRGIKLYVSARALPSQRDRAESMPEKPEAPSSVA
jgi:hypothetical protein